MLQTIAVLILAQSKPVDYFDRCLKAHRALSAADISIQSNTGSPDPTKPATYRLVYVRPNQVRLRIQLPEAGGLAASDRTFAIVGTKLTAYDATAQEKLTGDVKAGTSLAERMSTVTGALNDAVLTVLDPDHLAKLFDPLRSLKDITVSKEGNNVVLVRRLPGTVTGRWMIDAKSNLLKRITIVSTTGTLDWAYSYGPRPKSAAFTPPAKAVTVDEFSEKAPPARYTSAKAKQIGSAALMAVDHLQSAVFTIKTQDGTSKVSVSSGKLREDLVGRSWAYDGQVLTASIDATKSHYKSKKGRSSAVDAIGDLFLRPMPYVRSMLLKQNPLYPMLAEGFTVKYAGSISVAGVQCDLLESKAGERIRNVLTLRKDNHLPIIIRTENRVSESDEALISEMKIEYITLNKPLPNSMFSIGVKKGFTSKPFPKRKEH